MAGAEGACADGYLPTVMLSGPYLRFFPIARFCSTISDSVFMF